MRSFLLRTFVKNGEKFLIWRNDNFTFDVNGRKFSKTGRKHWEKEKLLITSNFSFSHSVFK